MKNYQKSVLAALILLPVAAEEIPAVHTIRSPIDRAVIVRLKNKTDMLDGLKQAVAREKIRNAVFISGFGSVTAYHTHVVGNTTLPRELEPTGTPGTREVRTLRLGSSGMTSVTV